MSGHSKWHTIKHKKGAADAKRGKMFEKLAKESECIGGTATYCTGTFFNPSRESAVELAWAFWKQYAW